MAQILEKYAAVLEAMRVAEGGRPVTEPSSPTVSDADAALVRDGFGDLFRVAVPVTCSAAAEPFDTSPADVVGWVHEHYLEHIQQVADLRSALSRSDH